MCEGGGGTEWCWCVVCVCVVGWWLCVGRGRGELAGLCAWCGYEGGVIIQEGSRVVPVCGGGEVGGG